MKTTLSHQPRFLCRAVRFWLEVERVDLNALKTSVQPRTSAEPNNALGSTRSTRHVAACADCQQYFAGCHDLESALRREAGGRRVDVAPNLEQRIIRAVNLSKPPAKTSLLRPGLLAFTGVAAAIALTIFQLTRPAHPTQAQALAMDLPPTATVAAGNNATPGIPWNAALPAARNLLQQDPLNDEVNSVYHDAKSAVNFLAQNFLPSSPAASAASANGQPTAQIRIRNFWPLVAQIRTSGY